MEHSKKILVLVVVLYAGYRASAQSAEAAGVKPVVEMSPYIVTGEHVLPKPESWRYVFVSGFELTRAGVTATTSDLEVLSNLSVKNTRLFIEELQRHEIAAALIWPSLLRSRTRQPRIVIIDQNQQPTQQPRLPDALVWEGDPIRMDTPALSGIYSSNNYRLGSQMIRPEQGFGDAPLIETNPMGSRFVPDGAPDVLEPTPFHQGIQPLPDGFVVLHAREGRAAAYVNAGDPLAGTDRASEEQLAADLSKKNLLLSLASRPNPPPRWMQAGLGWLISSTRVTPTQINFASEPVLLTATKMPSLLAVLTGTTALSYEDELLAAAFTHYGLYGDNGKFTSRFITLVERQAQEPLTETLFKDTFGRSVSEVEVALATYTRNFTWFKSVEKRGRLPDLPKLDVREATQAEIARLKAEELTARGNADLALNELRVAYRRGEREPAMLSLLATLEEQLGSLERARKITASLLAQPSTLANILIVDAKLRYRDMLAGKKSGLKLTARETTDVLAPLARAVQAGRSSEKIWEFLAEVVLNSSGRPHESITNLLKIAAHEFPSNNKIREAADSALR